MSQVQLPNPHLDSLEEDFTYHLGIPLDQDTAERFKDVQYVCIGGTPGRMRAACRLIGSRVFHRDISDDDSFDHVFHTERYSGFKVGAVLCVSHGMGLPSLSIMLHELFKLLRCANCRDVTIIRIGTCGGVGVPPGTVIVTDEALTVGMEPLYHTSSFGVPLSLPVKADLDVINCLKRVASSEDTLSDVTVVCAKTYCADDFYQGQGRLDGSFCDKTEGDKQEFLTKLYDLGVRNIDMESAGVLALTHKMTIKAAVVCVSLLDRFQTDLVTSPPQLLREWVDRPIRLVTEFIRCSLGQE